MSHSISHILPLMNTHQPSMTQWIQKEIKQTNYQLIQGDKGLKAIAKGESEDLGSTLITVQKAKLSFQFMQQITRQLMNAYNTVLKEPL